MHQGLTHILLHLHVETHTNSATIVAISILGIKETPPKRGTALLCIFLASGASYKFFFLQKEIICGIIINPQIALMVKAKRIINVYVNILLSITSSINSFFVIILYYSVRIF